MAEEYLSFMDTDQTIYYGDCHCYHCSDIKSSSCLKRFYTCIDKQFNTIRIAVCNSYIRIKIHNKINDEGRIYSSRYYDDTINDIVREVTGLKIGYLRDDRGGSHNILDRTLRISVCNKPYISASISIVEAIKTISEIDFWHPNVSVIHCEIIHNLRGYAEVIKRYIKHKKNYNTIQSLLNKLEGRYTGDYNSPMLSVLMGEFLQAIINQKTKQI